MKNIFYKNLVAVILLVTGFFANAQTTTPPPPPPGEEGDIGAISQPIDGYVIWLLIIGVAFIVATLINRSKQTKNI